ncbi:MAG: response regulator [Myxococcota bacterium]
MKRVLFVDDEQAVLDGLANLLRKQRKVWEMEFACGPFVALELLEQREFDVVVSDMRMPRMDGATLLRHVKEKQPAAVRVVLSGHSERDMVMRALAVAHQFVSKPCEADTLKSIIERTCALQATLTDPNIRELAGSIDRLPPVPGLYLELSAAIDRESTSAKDIAAIAERDPAMCAKVLQLANSAFFGRARHLTSTAQAVSFLGVEVLRGLALSAGIFASAIELSDIGGFSLEDAQVHALQTALLARELAPRELREEAFTAGLVHDIGKVVLAMGAPSRLEAALTRARQGNTFLHEAEMELFGTTHAEVGAYLLGMWGLPCSIVEAVAFHHRKSDLPELALIAQQADAKAHELYDVRAA